MKFPTIWPQFFTATIHKWNNLLKDDEYKDIIVDCLKFLVSDSRVEVNAFVIMSNHVHIIWQPLQHYTLTQIQTSFTTLTAKRIMKKLSETRPGILEEIKVNKYDRKHQVWKRESLSIELFTENVFMQKLDYIHENPVSAGLVTNPEDYKYSSAKFYELGIDEFDFITHYSGS
ncbi:MAG: transposase [Chitinophagaceae bacterium]|nr:transposase [Chitinophagaceae bacterium]